MGAIPFRFGSLISRRRWAVVALALFGAFIIVLTNLTGASAQSIDRWVNTTGGEAHMLAAEVMQELDCPSRPAPIGPLANDLIARAMDEEQALVRTAPAGWENFKRVYRSGSITGSDQICESLVNNINTAIEEDLVVGGSGSGGEIGEPTCNSTILSFGWLICPFVSLATNSIQKLDDWINTLLTIDTPQIFDQDEKTGRAYYSAWNSFRTIALGIIVIAALIVIISSAFGLEILDAYTIRKALPRILIAVLFIALSWSILEFLITLSNDVGNGVRWLIYEPFSTGEFERSQLNAGSAFVAGLLTTGGLLVLGGLGMLSFIGTALLAALIAFLVLVVRELIVVFLVIIAPIAIACLILPNTQKMWQLWQNTLTTLLVAFPIIAAIIATGRVFSVTIYQNDGDSSTLNELLAFAAYFLPYFILPFAFRLAGGAMANLAGIANDRGRGAFDRLKNYRGNKAKYNVERMRTGERFQGKNFLSRGFNRGSEGVGTFARAERKLGFLTSRAMREAAYGEQRDLNAMNHAKSDRGQAAQHNDPLLRAQTYSSEAEARANMGRDWGMSSSEVESAITAARANGGFSAMRQNYAARRLFATGTGYDNVQQALSTISRVANGNDALAASIAGEGNSSTKGVGRHDLAIGYGNYEKLYKKQKAGEALTDDDYDTAYQAAFEGVDGATLMRNKNASFKNLAPAMRRALAKQQQIAANPQASPAERANAQREVGRITGMIETLQSSSMYGAPKNVQVADDELYYPTGGRGGEREQIKSQTVEVVRDRRGNIVGVNGDYRPEVRRGYDQQKPLQRSRDPNDPNDPLNE